MAQREALAFLAADSYITVKTQAGVVKAESREYTETLPGTPTQN